MLIVEPSRFRTEFNAPGVLLTADARADYESVTGAVRQELTTADGLQEGDPVRAAAEIRQCRSTHSAEVPLRLPLGAEAVRNLTGAYERSLADARRWAPVSESADFPDVAPAQRAFATT